MSQRAAIAKVKIAATRAAGPADASRASVASAAKSSAESDHTSSGARCRNCASRRTVRACRED